MAGPDRLEELLNQRKVTGIDFVQVQDGQKTLDVHFLRAPESLDDPLIITSGSGSPKPDLAAEDVRIWCPAGDVPLREVPVAGVSAVRRDGEWVLEVKTEMPGDFTTYRLRIKDERVDSYYNDVAFSFKANCPSDLDCKPKPHECPREPAVDFPVDYQARDFWSFRRALLDFAAQRYPDWKEKLEADAGVMLAEALSALGDELAYYQDRIGREAYLETASQRRSLRRHAALVDYNVHDGLGATAWLDVQVKPEYPGEVPTDHYVEAGTPVWAQLEDGTKVAFEVGRGFKESTPGDDSARRHYRVNLAHNKFDPHIYNPEEDDTEAPCGDTGKHPACLPVGATELYIKGHYEADDLFDDLPKDSNGKFTGKWVLLQTAPDDPSIPERALMVRLTTIEPTRDEVLGQDITRLAWDEAQALPFEMNLMWLSVRGNLVPVTAGETRTVSFVVGTTGSGTLPRTVEREGPDGTVAHLFSLPDSDIVPLVWLGKDPHKAQPEVVLVAKVVSSIPEEERRWRWKRSFVGSPSSQPFDRDFTLDDGVWKRVVGYQRTGKEIVHVDYASGQGRTIRFGDGEFGWIPAARTEFQVHYRLGNGRRTNLPAGTIAGFDQSLAGFVSSVSNPLPASGGMDPETPTEVRQLAPDAFRAITYRAVRPEDYAEAAERLTWVQRAGATPRWTGSWLSMFVTPDPKGAVVLTETQRGELSDQLDRFRQAGRETIPMAPRYVDLDLEISVCVEPNAYCGEVKEKVMEALFGKTGIYAKAGFFSPDNFTFGTPLLKSKLGAAIQAVPGVRACGWMRIRRRGWFDWREFRADELSYNVHVDEVIRLENNPLHPGRGSLRLVMEGGA